jgi:excisionase family DNA binding protein
MLERTAHSQQRLPTERGKNRRKNNLTLMKSPSIQSSSPGNAAQHAATVGEREHKKNLLTVQDVAALLQVPVSWVYGRMRKRSLERLPAYRLGKYWRFDETEVLTWVESHRRDSHAA